MIDMSHFRRPLARILRAPTSIALVVAVLGGIVVSAALAGRGVGEPRIPVAVVNNDVITTTGEGADEQTIAAGRAVAAELTEPDSDGSSLLAFTMTGEEQARAGLENGDYYAAVIIPKTFSQDVARLGSPDPVVAQVLIMTNSINGRIVGEVSEQVTASTVAAFGDDLTVQYLESNIEAQSSLSDGLSEAAAGADEIATGTAELSTSSDDLAAGAVELASGAASLSTSADQLVDGADTVSAAARSVASGADDLVAGATRLTGVLEQVADADAKIAASAGDLAEGLDLLSAAANQVVDASQGVDQGATDTSQGLGKLQPIASGSAASAAQLAAAVAQLAASCPPTAGAYCNQVSAALPTASTVAKQTDGVAEAVAGLAQGAADLTEGTGALGASTRSLAQGTASSQAAARAVADAAASSANAAADAAEGSRQLTSSSKQVASGAADLSAGSDDLRVGTSSLAEGARETDQAAAEVAEGSDLLSEAANSLTEPTDQLATSLAETSDALPAYDEDESERVASTVAAPVTTEVQDLYPGIDSRVSVVPLAVLIALLCLTAAVCIARTPLPAWAISGGGATGRIIVTGLRPGLVSIALASLTTLSFAAVGIPVARPLSLMLLTALGGITLLALFQAIVSLVPRRAYVVAVAFLAVQLLALPWGVPIDLAPSWVQSLNQVLPIPALLRGLDEATVGTDPRSIDALLVLGAWTVMSLLVTALTISRAYRRVEPLPHVVNA